MRSQALISTWHRALASLGQSSPSEARSMTTLTRVVFAKEDMSTDNQEDSSADPEVLNKSKETAARQEKVNLGESIDAAEESNEAVRFEPEVTDSSRGSGFPHQTAEERKSDLATSTQGEAPVKTREYTPTKGESKIYPEE